MLLNDNALGTQYYIKLESGQEIGPYLSYEAASTSAATLPLVEGGTPPQIIPKTLSGATLLFG